MRLGTMFFYSLILTLGFVLMLPLLILRREKYASGFRERLGDHPRFEQDGRPVIWLHCVSVGETNAARPLVDGLLENFPDHRLIVSTTTKTGRELARTIFKDKADAVIYFPFDWKFSVRKALDHYKPSVVLLMETEIWPRFIREAKLSGAKIAIVNGRLSASSASRYAKVSSFVKKVLADIDLALMQNEKDAERSVSLGIDAAKVKVTGNLKFDQSVDDIENEMTDDLRKRFAIDGMRLLIVAASTHAPEEQWILESLDGMEDDFRLLIAPRHPERFDEVAKLLDNANRTYVRRSRPRMESDRNAKIILLDSVGELRAVYPLADIVFVGGSLIPHGGQSVLEPAAAGKAMITGPYTHNFDAVVKDFTVRDALIQTPKVSDNFQNADRLYEEFTVLLSDPARRRALGENARNAMAANRGATLKTINELRKLFHVPDAAAAETLRSDR
ncbi:MAG TPA: 3-deoxy-D-manno-octulosonic acid transferase [Pyrinomonadaceae bacterium]|nr:3-deoxy-D-manno-octulosonic acid transferase [Pyrinomonadaceae bacterium]